MKILKKGNPPKEIEQEYIKKCFWCKSIFTYTKDDIQWGMEFDQYIECPVCGHSVSVPLFFKKKYKGDSNE